jgi:hypothetical protein
LDQATLFSYLLLVLLVVVTLLQALQQFVRQKLTLQAESLRQGDWHHVLQCKQIHHKYKGQELMIGHLDQLKLPLKRNVKLELLEFFL